MGRTYPVADPVDLQLNWQTALSSAYCLFCLCLLLNDALFVVEYTRSRCGMRGEKRPRWVTLA